MEHSLDLSRYDNDGEKCRGRFFVIPKPAGDVRYLSGSLSQSIFRENIFYKERHGSFEPFFCHLNILIKLLLFSFLRNLRTYSVGEVSPLTPFVLKSYLNKVDGKCNKIWTDLRSFSLDFGQRNPLQQIKG